MQKCNTGGTYSEMYARLCWDMLRSVATPKASKTAMPIDVTGNADS